MNKSYRVSSSGEVFVSDQCGIYKLPYQEGIEEVLEQENIVEEIQNNIRLVEKKIENLGKIKNPKKVFWKIFGISNLLVILTEITVFSLLANALGGFDAMLAEKCVNPPLLTNVPLVYVIGGVITAAYEPILLGFSACLSSDKKEKCREYNALNAQLDYLKQREQEEVSKLARMKQRSDEKAIVETKDYLNKEINLDNLKKLRAELTGIYKENYRVPEKDKQKTLN